MLAAAPAGTLYKWRQYYAAEPWGDDWQQTSLIVTQLINTIRAIAVGMGGKKPNKQDMLDWDAFVPKPAEQAKPKQHDLQKSAAILRSMCGV